MAAKPAGTSSAPITPEIRARALTAFEAGKSVDEVAQELGLKKSLARRLERAFTRPAVVVTPAPITQFSGPGLLDLLRATATPDAVAECERTLRRDQETREQLLAAGDFKGYIESLGSHDRFQAFLKIIAKLSPEQYWPVLRTVWDSAETTLQHRDEWLRLWLLDRPGRQSAMTDEERAVFVGLPDVVNIWRGCGDLFGVKGLSWSLDREQAVAFAHIACDEARAFRSGLRGSAPWLAAASCRKGDVFAYLADREEAEIVVNPDRVAVSRIDLLPPEEE